MKNQNKRIVSMLALAATVAAGASTASAAGLLGQRYVSATLDYIFWDDDPVLVVDEFEVTLDDGLGATIVYNQPLANSLDLSLSYAYLSSDLENTSISIHQHDIDFGATWYTPVANGRVFVAGELGWARASSQGESDSTTTWGIATGYEFPIGSAASATPYIAYTDFFESEYDGGFSFGIIGEFELQQGLSLLMSAYGNDDSDFGVSGGLLFRF